MRVLVAHNTYQQRGGEDVVFEQESSALAMAGVDVRRFLVRNDHIRGLAGRLAAGRTVISNRKPIADLIAAVEAFKPDLVHIHNFFPTLSPASIEAVVQRNIPVVQTLHNYRLICSGAALLRDGRPCEECVGNSKLPGIIHGCYRRSRIGSGLVSVIGPYLKRLLTKYPHALTLVALTEFAKSRFVADGFPAERIAVRGNAIADPGCGLLERERRIVYVGRLSPEKGVDTLLAAAGGVEAVVEIIGEGPNRKRLEATAPPNVIFRGQLARNQVFERIKSAAALVVPSRWYEGFPMVVLEAMGTGTPTLASRLGSLSEILADGKTGLLFPPDDKQALRAGLSRLLADPDLGKRLGMDARNHFLARYSEEKGLEALKDIYKRSLYIMHRDHFRSPTHKL